MSAAFSTDDIVETMSQRHEADELSTVLQQKYEPSPAPANALALTVTEGVDVGARFVIEASCAGRVLVGCSPACDLRLTDREVSRRHAAFEWDGARLKVRDLGSRNGTLVDHVPVVEAYLAGGEIVRVGSTALRVETVKPSATDEVPAATSFGRAIGASREMRRLYPLCAKLAAANVPVIVEGETGTGKEVLAEALHEMGPRAGGPFIVFDCTAVPANLVESELFGHDRGAFTGAVQTRKGVFEQADGGTLLIDEIGDLDLALQPKLLRALERSEIRRVGGDRWIRVDVRVISATRRDLDHEIQVGRFRDDLFHRLAVARIELPPLRQRRGDIALLARHFARQMGAGESALSAELLARWDDLPWPGNVRELRNAVARYLALGEAQPVLETASLGDASPSGDDVIERVLAQNLPLPQARRRVVDEFEQRYIERVLAAHGGNVVRAAAASGIARRYFQILRAKSK